MSVAELVAVDVLQGIWIDDNLATIRVTVPHLRRHGVEVQIFADGASAIEVLRAHPFDYSFVLLDLEPDGLDTYAALRRVAPDIPIIVVSAHLPEDRWKRDLAALPESLEQIPKPFPMATSREFEGTVARIRDAAERYGATRRRGSLTEAECNGAPSMALQEFMTSSDGARRAFLVALESVCAPLVARYFESHSNVDWVVVSAKVRDVIASGGRTSMPGEQRLRTLAESANAPVLLCGRPKKIEDTDGGCSKWSTRRGGDHDAYPTVCMEFMTARGAVCVVGDFDTGSEGTFFSYEHLRELGVVGPYFFLATSEVLWGQKYWFYPEPELRCELVGLTRRRAVSVAAELVVDWQKSPQVSHYPTRVALVGRPLLLDNELRLILDGRRRATDIAE